MVEIHCAFEAMGAVFKRAMLEQLRRDVNAVREFGFPAVARKVASRAASSTRKLDKVFNGTYLQGWAWEPDATGGTVRNVAPHAWSVEFGTPPGSRVDWFAIHEWVRVKLYGLPRRHPIPVLAFGRAIPLTAGASTLFRQRIIRSRMERAMMRSAIGKSRAALENEAHNATDAIVKAIRERGIAPTFIFRDALLEAPRDLGSWVRRNLPFKEEIPF